MMYLLVEVSTRVLRDASQSKGWHLLFLGKVIPKGLGSGTLG